MVEGDLLRVVSCVAQSHYSYNPDGLIIVSGRTGFRSTVLAVRVYNIYNYNFISIWKTARERMTNADDITLYNITYIVTYLCVLLCVVSLTSKIRLTRVKYNPYKKVT